VCARARARAHIYETYYIYMREKHYNKIIIYNNL